MYAVGDVTGPPGLASSAQMGGRAVANYLFKDKMQRLRQYMLESSTDLEVRRRIVLVVGKGGGGGRGGSS